MNESEGEARLLENSTIRIGNSYNIIRKHIHSFAISRVDVGNEDGSKPLAIQLLTLDANHGLRQVTLREVDMETAFENDNETLENYVDFYKQMTGERTYQLLDELEKRFGLKGPEGGDANAESS